MEPYWSTREGLKQSVTLPRDELVAEARAQAVKTAREFFLRSGWKPSMDQLADHQRELTERSEHVQERGRIMAWPIPRL